MGKRQKILMIATVGEDQDAVLIGVRDYPVQKLILMYTPAFETEATDIANKVRAIHVETQLRRVNGDSILMDTLQQIAEINSNEAVLYDDVVVNISSGDKMQTCSALSAAFVQGLPAIGIAGGSPFALPVLKFSYSELISDAKYRILDALQKIDGRANSLSALSEASGVEKSLLSYHLRTTREGKGLEEMGLVEIERGSFGRLGITLSEMGSLILMGRGRIGNV